MKTAFPGILLALTLGCTPVAPAAPPSATTVEVTAQRKKEEAGKSAGKVGGEAKKTEHASYTITVKNISMGDVPPLTVEYLLFVERQKLGEKKTAHPFLQRKTGSAKIEAIPRSGSQTATTEAVDLVTENLVGGYHFSDGGRIRAEDSIAGIWVRAMQDGKIVGEYAMPANITSKGWDDKLKSAAAGN